MGFGEATLCVIMVHFLGLIEGAGWIGWIIDWWSMGAVGACLLEPNRSD
jgi:hypothetical protein